MQNITKIIKVYRRINPIKIAAAFILAVALFFAPAYSSASLLNENYSYTILAAANKSSTTYPTDDKNVDGLLYSNSDKVESLNSVDDFIDPQTKSKLLDPTQIPAQKQPILDRTNPDAKLLEKTVKMFKEAGDFSAN